MPKQRSKSAETASWKCGGLHGCGKRNHHSFWWCEGCSTNKPKRVWDELPSAPHRKPQGKWAIGPPQDSRKLLDEIKELKAKLRHSQPSEVIIEEATEEMHSGVDSQARHKILNALYHTKDPLLLELHAKLKTETEAAKKAKQEALPPAHQARHSAKRLKQAQTSAEKARDSAEEAHKTACEARAAADVADKILAEKVQLVESISIEHAALLKQEAKEAEEAGRTQVGTQHGPQQSTTGGTSPSSLYQGFTVPDSEKVAWAKHLQLVEDVAVQRAKYAALFKIQQSPNLEKVSWGAAQDISHPAPGADDASMPQQGGEHLLERGVECAAQYKRCSDASTEVAAKARRLADAAEAAKSSEGLHNP